MNILALVLAGGEGQRLRPLTDHQAKPAVPFVDGCRIIDFVLANLANSDVSTIYVLAQYKPRPLIEHLRAHWAPWFRRPGRMLDVLLADGHERGGGYRGTADAVHRNLGLVLEHRPDVVAVFAADHVYRMDVRQMVHFHVQHDADVTVSALPVPVGEARSFGVMATNARHEIERFDEKPAEPRPIPGDPSRAFASMGNYLFRPAVLHRLLERASSEGGTDFGRHVMPALPASGCRALAYDFAANEVPGLLPHEERGYWRDVGTLDALARARSDIRGPKPKLDLANRAWPIRRELSPHPLPA